MPDIDPADFRRRMNACLMGKAVGGTLGMPYEGVLHRLDLEFYDPVPTQMLPNDDLDLQVVYAYLLDRMSSPRVSRDVFIPAWQNHIGMSPDEYGICKRNLKLGLKPPVTGRYDNWFQCGMGAAIRTEIWACLAAGDPPLAAAYAYEDACLDHAGDGIYAAQFLAALEALAFVETDTDRLLDTALMQIPATCAVRCAVEDTRRWHARLSSDVQVYHHIMQTYGHENFTNVVHNVAFVVLGWLEGKGDFGRAICSAVNCGQDADCTGATLGALLGIIDPDAIQQQWTDPIGNDLLLSPSIHGVEHPPTLDQFTDLLIDLRERINGIWPPLQSEADSETHHLGIVAQVGFLPWIDTEHHGTQPPDPHQPPRMPTAMRNVTLPGSVAHWPYEKTEGGTLVVRYRIHMDQPIKAKVLFNTPQHVRVFIDGQFAFAREGGRMCPALHRPPLNQMTSYAFTRGEHELVAQLIVPAQAQDLTWFAGLGTDSGVHGLDDWLTDVFQRPPKGERI